MMNRCDVITFYGAGQLFDKLSFWALDQNSRSCDKTAANSR
jgi:hypothetical protein